MLVHHLNCGTMRPLGGRRVSGQGGLLRPARLVCHCLLIETGDRLVLVDSGIGLADIDRPADRLGRSFIRTTRPRLDPAETALRQVIRLGYRVQDIRDIVLTHLDCDHAGGLADFPHARVHVHTRELWASRHPATPLERGRYHTKQWAHGPQWIEHDTGGERWCGFESVRQIPELPPELLLVPLPGHTRGHLGVAVDTGRTDQPRWLLHAGDSYFFRDELDRDRPWCPPILAKFERRVQADETTRLSNMERLAELSARGEVAVFSAHDPIELAELVTAVGHGANTAH